MNKLIHSSKELTFDLRQTPSMPLARQILMVRPTFFHVDNPINPHMRKADGTLHQLDKPKAMKEWEVLRETYVKLGFSVHEADAQEGLPDMVFCANQSLPFVSRTGLKTAIMSNMANDTRHKEVPALESALTRLGYKTEHLPARSSGTLFEGMGDALWLPGHRVLLGGYGHRTTQEIYGAVFGLVDATVITFELANPRFYHLDTCLSILDSQSALACKEAFTAEGWALVKQIFPKLIEVSVSEADSPVFACNAHCPDGRHVIMQSGAERTVSALKSHGFIPIELSTEEFVKSGGSVFCMKLQFF
ncbi:MAG: amidinotransferase [Proteobacteria bacterium]|nr:amidinotransferase [Pseudomonadota bacterium]